MKIVSRLVSLCVCTLVFASSCQKELTLNDSLPVTEANAMYGNWKFVNMEVSSVVTGLMEDDFMKLETEMATDYVTENNKGTLVIEPGIVRSNNIQYDIAFVSKIRTKVDGVLSDSTDYEFDFSMPPSSSVSQYTTSGDSIFTKSGVIDMQGSISPTEPVPGKFKVEGNKLTLSFQIDRILDESTPGVISRSITKTSATINLERQ